MAAQRPGWKETLAIVLACAALLVVLARLDNSAARSYAARAQKALDRQARAHVVAARRPHVVVAPVFGGAWFDAQPAPRRHAATATASAPASRISAIDALVIAMAMGGVLMAAGGVVLLRR